MTEDVGTLALKALALGMVLDRVRAADGLNRQDLAAAMVVTERKPVELPLAGVPMVVGSVTLAKGGISASVSDPAALLEWAKANQPDAVETTTTETLAPWFTEELLKIAKRDGQAVDSVTGEVVPGITVRESNPVVKVVRDKSDEAQAAIADVLFAQHAAGLRSLLAVEPPNGDNE